MTDTLSISAYPPSVQPGIPQLGSLPAGWSRSPIGSHLVEVRRPVELDNDKVYHLVTVKRARGGVVKRETLLGRDISVKSQFEIQEGDFLISKRQIVHGACGVVPKSLHGSTVSNEYSVLRVRDTLDLNFLKYLSHAVHFQQTCFHSSIGVHIEKMIFKLDHWFGWEFDLPPTDEQRRIAEILGTWDRAIEKTEKLISASKDQKQSLMQQLLKGERRLPGFREKWREVQLSELGIFLKGTGVSRSDVVPVGLPAVRYGEIYTTHHFVIESFHSFISADAASCSLRMEQGDILFTCSGETAEEIGKSVAYLDEVEAYAGGDIILLRGHGQSARFLGYALNSADVVRQKTRFGQGNSVVHINAGNLSEIVVSLPPVDEQDAIASVLQTAQQDVQQLTELLQRLKTEKTALMQQLLTGKRRVRATEMTT